MKSSNEKLIDPIKILIEIYLIWISIKSDYWIFMNWMPNKCQKHKVQSTNQKKLYTN